MFIRTLYVTGMALVVSLLSVVRGEAKETVRITAEPQRSVFVGTEPIKIRCVILVTTGVRVWERDLQNAEVSPFTLESVTIGERIAIPERKDEAFIETILVVRPPADLKLGTHVFPALEVEYAYDSIKISGRMPMRKVHTDTAVTQPLALEKVSLYAETDLLHEVARIGDENVISLDVHMDSGIELYNDLLPDAPLPDVSYLQEPVFREPQVLLGVERTERSYEHHRIVAYRYRFSIMAVPSEPVPVALPAITYGSKGGSQSDVRTKDIGSSRVRMVSILNKDTTFEPMQGIFTEAPWEVYAFWWMPLGLLVVTGTGFLGLTLHEAFSMFHRWRTKRTDTDTAGDELVFNFPKLVYERSVTRLLRRARRELTSFNASPSLETCVILRNTAARIIAADSRETVSRQAACAMTASELAEIVRGTTGSRMLRIVRDLDHQLEHRHYVPLQDWKAYPVEQKVTV